MSFPRRLFSGSGKGPSLRECDRSSGPPQGRLAPAAAGRLRRSLPRLAAAVIAERRSGRSNGPLGRTKQLELAQSHGRRTIAQGSVWPHGIVVVEPAGQSRAALLGGRVGLGISPFAQAGLDQSFGLAIGARRIRPGALVLDASGGECSPSIVGNGKNC